MSVIHHSGGLPGGGLAYPFPSNLWPVTEAAAISTFYVNEFTGSGDESGVGMGLSGSGLVLPAVNGPGSYNGWGRQISASTHQAFKVPVALLDAWYNSGNSPRGFGALYHLKNCSVGSDGSFLFKVYAMGSSGSVSLFEMNGSCVYGTRYGLTFGLREGPDGGNPLRTSNTVFVADKFPNNDEFWLAFSYREAVGNLPAYCMAGWKAGATQPGGFGDCDHYTVYTPPIEEMSKGDFSTVYGHDRTTAIDVVSDAAESIVGNEWVYSDTAGFYIKSLTLGRVPFGEL